MDIERLISQLKVDEGFATVAFWDFEQWTYGWGCRAPYEGAIISEKDAEDILCSEVEEAITDFEYIYSDCLENINDVRSEALTNMCFNLGRTKLLKFRKMNAHIRNEDWHRASLEAANSRWFTQVGNRAKRICMELATGEKK